MVSFLYWPLCACPKKKEKKNVMKIIYEWPLCTDCPNVIIVNFLIVSMKIVLDACSHP